MECRVLSLDGTAVTERASVRAKVRRCLSHMSRGDSLSALRRATGGQISGRVLPVGPGNVRFVTHRERNAPRGDRRLAREFEAKTEISRSGAGAASRTRSSADGST